MSVLSTKYLGDRMQGLSAAEPWAACSRPVAGKAAPSLSGRSIGTMRRTPRLGAGGLEPSVILVTFSGPGAHLPRASFAGQIHSELNAVVGEPKVPIELVNLRS